MRVRRLHAWVLWMQLLPVNPYQTLCLFLTPFASWHPSECQREISERIGNYTLVKLFEGVCCGALLQLWSNLLGKGHVTYSSRQVNKASTVPASRASGRIFSIDPFLPLFFANRIPLCPYNCSFLVNCFFNHEVLSATTPYSALIYR